MKLNELMKLCTTLQSRVLALEQTKTNQALEINSLKRRVKKLEKKQGSRTHKLKRLYKVGLTARVESPDNEQSLGKDASKHGRIKDVETLWKLVKAKHVSTRPEEGYETELWGDLKVMFDPHVEDEVWKIQQRYNVYKEVTAAQDEVSTAQEFQRNILNPSKTRIHKSEAGSWGRDKDDNNNDRDSISKGNDQESDSGDDNTQSYNEKGSDSKHETDKNEAGSKSNQEENEEEVEDDEEEKDDEFVKTPSISTYDEYETNNESKVEEKAKGDKDKGMDYTTNQFDDDVNVRLNEPVDTDEGFI
nr:hypothetical protein [Tanacetum cinerariifolium]